MKLLGSFFTFRPYKAKVGDKPHSEWEDLEVFVGTPPFEREDGDDEIPEKGIIARYPSRKDHYILVTGSFRTGPGEFAYKSKENIPRFHALVVMSEMTSLPSESYNRPLIHPALLNMSIREVQDRLVEVLEKKGYGALASTHEILGVLEEEHLELKEAVRSNDVDKVISELYDIAVGAVFAIATLENGKYAEL